MSNIAVIGEKNSVMGFRALGLDVFYTSNDNDTRKTLHRLAQEGTTLIYITETAAKNILSDIDKYKDKKLPAVILIPGGGKSIGIGMAGIKKSVERAVGADILFKD